MIAIPTTYIDKLTTLDAMATIAKAAGISTHYRFD
jgi:hypothetical protein